MGAVNRLSALSKLPFHTDPLRLHALPGDLLVPRLEHASLRGPHALHASSLQLLPGAMHCYPQRWAIHQGTAGLGFGFRDAGVCGMVALIRTAFDELDTSLSVTSILPQGMI